MKRLHLIISGDVQGVSFRSWARQQAQELELVGWVANREDETVELVVEGPKEKLEEMIARCRSGPEVAWVKEVAVGWEEARGEFVSFDIVY